jgi:transposase
MVTPEAKMSTPYEIVGIDVGARELVVARDGGTRDGGAAPARWSNMAAGRGRLVAALRASGRPVRVVLEATGVYFLDLARELVAGGAAVMVVNPKAAHHFAEAMLRRRKDDPVDAAILREYGRRMAFRPWVPPAPALYELRELARQAQAFGKQGAAAKNRLHAARATGLTPAAVLSALERQIAQTEALRDELLAAARARLAGEPELRRRFALADGLPGVGPASALALLGELAPLPPGLGARQWVAQAGLDVREERSGTSVHKRARLSKRGNKRLREALFHPPLTAVRCCPEARAFADRLVARGKTRLQAICAVMRKLLHGLHAVWKTGDTFKAGKLFPPNHADA